MSLAKIVVTGTVKKNPEKRFSQNNFAVTSLVVDINPQDETLVRVVAYGSLADKAADTVKMGDNVLIEGKLQMETVKTSNGKERKVAVVQAGAVEVMGGSAVASSQGAQAPSGKEPIVQFSTDEIAEDLLDPDEIPF